MAMADDMTSDIALEIGADLDPGRFVAVARAFFGLVEAVTAVGHAGRPLAWHVRVREGSNILALDPAPSVSPAEATAAIDRIDSAVRALVSGDLAETLLDEEALDNARKLSDLATVKGGATPMRLWVRRSSFNFGPDIGEVIRDETKPAYRDFGSIEGTLNAIQDGAGGLELRIRDPLWRRAIKCSVPEEMLDAAMQYFRQRVEVFGEIYYRNDDTPHSIRVHRLVHLPNDDDLPSIEDVRGLLSDGVALE